MKYYWFSKLNEQQTVREKKELDKELYYYVDLNDLTAITPN